MPSEDKPVEPGSEARFLLQLGKAHNKNKDYAAAITELNKAVGLGYDDAEVYLELGRAYRERREFDSAIKEFVLALGRRPSDPHIHFELGHLYREKSEQAKAVEEFKAAIEGGLDDIEVYLELGRTYRERGDVSLAQGALESALARNNLDGRVYLEMARAYLKDGDFDSGRKELEAAVGLGYDDAEVYLELGRAYRERREFDSAIKEFVLALGRRPSDPHIHFELGHLYREKSEQAKAVEEFKAAIEGGLDSDDLHFELGKIHHENREYDSAVKEVLEAIRRNPERTCLYLELADIYVETHNHALAAEEINRAIKMGIQNEDIYFKLGMVCLKAGDFASALDAFKSCLRYNPQRADIHLCLAYIHKENKDYEAAAGELKKAIDRGVTDENVHLELGRIYRKQGEYLLAESELRRASKMNMLDGSPNAELAWLYEDRGEYALAIEELKSALVKGFDQEHNQQNLERLCSKQRVIEEFDRYIENSKPGEQDANTGVVTEYIFQEGYGSFIKRLEGAVRANQENVCVHLELAWVRYWNKQFDLLIDELKTINKLFQSLPDLRCAAYNKIYAEGKPREPMIEEFEAALKADYYAAESAGAFKDEFIMSLNELFPDKADEISRLVSGLSGLAGMYKWRYPAITRAEGEILYLIVRLLKPSVIVESGTWMGTSTAYLAKACIDNNKGRVITVDKNKDVGYAVTEEFLPRIEFYKGVDISEAMEAICQKEQNIDMFFHDSNNSSELLSWEIERILPVMNRKGLILVHDVFNSNRSAGSCVGDFFDEIKGRAKCSFFNTGKGLGVIREIACLEQE